MLMEKFLGWDLVFGISAMESERRIARVDLRLLFPLAVFAVSSCGSDISTWVDG